MLKRIILICGLGMLAMLVYADYLVNFEGTGETKTAYASGTVTLSGLDWNLSDVLIGTENDEWKIGLRSARLRGYGTSAMTMLANKTDGIGTLSFYYSRYKNDGQVDWKAEYSTDNGMSWIQIGDSFSAPADNEVYLFSEQVNISGNVRIRILRSTTGGTSNKRLNIDDILLTDHIPNQPALAVEPNQMDGFGYEYGEGPSGMQSYYLSGSNLSPANGFIQLGQSSSFEFSVDGSLFAAALQLPYSGGQISRTLWVRMKAGLGFGPCVENVSHEGGGAEVLLGLSGFVSASQNGFTGTYEENFFGFTSLEGLPAGWVLSDEYSYMGDFGTGSAGGLRGNGVLGIQLTGSAPNNQLTANLSLINQTGSPINTLNISYLGRVARVDLGGTPQWSVSLDGMPIEELAYSTAEGENRECNAILQGLDIQPGASFTLSWFTTSQGTNGVRRQIGISNLSISTRIDHDGGYYDGITGYGAELKAMLHLLLRNTHTNRFSYDALWTQLPYTDQDPDNPNNVIEIYTGWSIPASHAGGGTTQWNREHVWSKSHAGFGDSAPAGTDLHHLRPCDATVNSAKGNRDFDEGGNPYTDSSPYPGYSGSTGCYSAPNTWEPRDEDKGDVARMMMYMAVRYEATDTGFDLELVDQVNTAANNEPHYGKLSTLLNWHVQDPPDSRERLRNERIFERQGNRNPFIDDPSYAQYIWSPVPSSATGITQSSFVANWSSPISATKYYLQVASDSLFTDLINGFSHYDVGLSNAKTISGLAHGITYYYRLRSFFGTGYSMYSPWLAVRLQAPAVTAELSALDSVYEYELDGARLQINLSGASFFPSLNSASFTLVNHPQGLSIASAQYVSTSEARLTLAWDGSNFDENYMLSILILPAATSSGMPISTSSVKLLAYVETLLNIQLADGRVQLDIQEVQDAVAYHIFASAWPYTGFVNVSEQGTFEPLVPTRWIHLLMPSRASFYMAAGIRE